MQRTFTTSALGSLTHRGKYLTYLLADVRSHFFNPLRFKNWSNHRVRITITKGTKYQFKLLRGYQHYHIYLNGKDVAHVCVTEFVKIFFKPDLNKTYNITVKEVS